MTQPPAAAPLVVIPARLAATRLPRKPLLEIAGRPLIRWVWERARTIRDVGAVVVATDSEEIAAAVAAFGGEAVLTAPDCATGTDRVAEAVRGRPEDLIVNLQGDEPEFDVRDVERLIEAMIAEPSLPIGTLAAPAEADEIERASAVKVVCDQLGRALYFSRSAIPHRRGGAADEEAAVAVLRHVGIYAFRRAALERFAAAPPTPLERSEKLEQLRALENGWAVRVVLGHRAPPGIDTPEDLAAFRARVSDSNESVAVK